ncbi:MAG: potassium-transporting ATPase subunit C [SAR324 cluster bacterium]|nr:potassium-transporting ATPase subunit C [SAR324 cluster bacterium]
MIKEFARSILAILIFSIILGIMYPLFILLVGQFAFSNQANGSLIFDEEQNIIGSKLIGQGFSSDKYLWPRYAKNNYKGLGFGADNLALSSLAFSDRITELKNRGVSGDLLFESASGLDPHISVASALGQVDRIIKSRNITKEQVELIISKNTSKYFPATAYVNVLMVNLDLDMINNE